MSNLHQVTVLALSGRGSLALGRPGELGFLSLCVDVLVAEELALRVADILLIDADEAGLVLVEVVHALSVLLGPFAEADCPGAAVLLLAEFAR